MQSSPQRRIALRMAAPSKSQHDSEETRWLTVGTRTELTVMGIRQDYDHSKTKDMSESGGGKHDKEDDKEDRDDR